jgi:uncharacterized protein (DUF736 family)
VASSAFAGAWREPSQGGPAISSKGDLTMAITLGTFTKQGDASGYVGTLKTLNVTAALTIVPVDRASENAPDYRIYAGRGAPSFEVGAAWSQTAKSSGETYLNLKLAAPEFGERWLRARLVKLETPTEDGATHLALWQPRDA